MWGGGVGASEAGGAVASWAGDDAGARGVGDRGGGVGAAVVDDDALGDEVPGHLGGRRGRWIRLR